MDREAGFFVIMDGESFIDGIHIDGTLQLRFWSNSTARQFRVRLGDNLELFGKVGHDIGQVETEEYYIGI